MRDIVIVAIVALAALIALRRPWIGILLWIWLSLMNPHRFAYGFSYDAPLSAIAAVCTMIGMLTSQVQKESPFKGTPIKLFAVFTVWITISWLMGLDRDADYWQWNKVMKINVMLIIGLALMCTREHIMAMAWVCALSLGLLGAKGGVFTIINGGSYKVWGPPDSFIADNNEFALALVMTIPLLRFVQMQVQSKWGRHLLTLMMLLCAASALGSHSRGGLLAILAMTLLLWWRGKKRLYNGILLVIVGVLFVAFMPDSWSERMGTIETYNEDQSAQGRFSAWWVSWRVALAYPFGIGFNLARPELFAQYSPWPELGTPVAHSIYFQVLGHHGFVGLAMFLSIWLSTWWVSVGVRRDAAKIPEARWCGDMAAMCQTSLIGYFVGGAFLSLAYFDLPYYVMSMLVMVRVWMMRKGWQTDPPLEISRWPIPGAQQPADTTPVSPAPAAVPPGRGPSPATLRKR